jgi:PqqD family protein of HPr-rel-A system
MNDAGEPAWKVGGEVQLLWRQWDGEYIVFNPASGDTHLLNTLAGQTLQCLERAPCTLATLTESVASELELDANEELRQQLAKLLVQFETLSLIEGTRS